MEVSAVIADTTLPAAKLGFHESISPEVMLMAAALFCSVKFAPLIDPPIASTSSLMTSVPGAAFSKRELSRGRPK
jgi:hypothetical protein